MNPLEYYNRQKEAWFGKEEEELKTEYEVDEMTISQIADIHKRTPGSISYKLKSMGIIQHIVFARGYMNYKNSELYKEIVQKGTTERKIKKEAKEKGKKNYDSIYSFVKATPIDTPFSEPPKFVARRREIVELRNEIETIKSDLKELLRLMRAVYEFEMQ